MSISPENATGMASGLMTAKPAAVKVVPTAPNISSAFSRLARFAMAVFIVISSSSVSPPSTLSPHASSPSPSGMLSRIVPSVSI